MQAPRRTGSYPSFHTSRRAQGRGHSVWPALARRAAEPAATEKVKAAARSAETLAEAGRRRLRKIHPRPGIPGERCRGGGGDGVPIGGPPHEAPARPLRSGVPSRLVHGPAQIPVQQHLGGGAGAVLHRLAALLTGVHGPIAALAQSHDGRGVTPGWCGRCSRSGRSAPAATPQEP